MSDPEKPRSGNEEYGPSTPELEVPKKYEYKQLSPEEEERLVDLLADRKQGPVEKKYAVYLVDGKDEVAQLGREVEVEVFGEFFDNDEELMQREYQPYEAHSKFLMVIDHENNKPAGVIRLIENSKAGLKSLNDIANPPWNKSLQDIFREDDIKPEDLDRTIDIATLAVTNEYRGKSDVSSALFSALYIVTRNENKDMWVTILDDNVLALLEALGIFFKRYKGVGSASYLDSPASTPVYGNAHNIARHVEENYPDTHKYVTLGEEMRKTIDFSAID